MFVPMWLLGLTALAFAVLARLAFARRGATGPAEMIEQQRRATPTLAAGEEAALLARPEIAQPLAAGRKIEAIREVRRISGLGLKEAKELVERWGKR